MLIVKEHFYITIKVCILYKHIQNKLFSFFLRIQMSTQRVPLFLILSYLIQATALSIFGASKVYHISMAALDLVVLSRYGTQPINIAMNLLHQYLIVSEKLSVDLLADTAADLCTVK